LENTEEKENTVLAIQPSKKKVAHAKNIRITINYLHILDAMFIAELPGLKAYVPMPHNL